MVTDEDGNGDEGDHADNTHKPRREKLEGEEPPIGEEGIKDENQDDA